MALSFRRASLDRGESEGEEEAEEEDGEYLCCIPTVGTHLERSNLNLEQNNHWLPVSPTIELNSTQIEMSTESTDDYDTYLPPQNSLKTLNKSTQSPQTTTTPASPSRTS